MLVTSQVMADLSGGMCMLEQGLVDVCLFVCLFVCVVVDVL